METLSNGAVIASAGDQPGDLIDRPRQIEWNGLLMGAGTPYRWVKLTGWDSLPGVDLGDAPRPHGHGDMTGPGWYSSRLVDLEVRVLADTPMVLESLLQLLAARLTYTDTSTALVVADSGRTLQAAARVIAVDIPHDPARTVGIAQIGVQWKAADPLRRGLTRHGVVLSRAVPDGGRDWPALYPTDWGVAGGQSSAVLNNAGTGPAAPVVTFVGPGTGHTLTIEGGRMLRVDVPLAVGDRLVVDTRTGTVTLNGTANRNSWVAVQSVPPESWHLMPGDTAVTLTVAEGGTAASKAEIDWYDTYA